MMRGVASIFGLLVVCVLSAPVLARTLSPPPAFDGVGNELIRGCPSFNCKVIKWGGILPRIVVLEISGDWVRVRLIERGYYDHGSGVVELPRSKWSTTTGWVFYTSLSKDIRRAIGEERFLDPDRPIGSGQLARNSKMRTCPSVQCGTRGDVDSGTIVDILRLDTTGEWYKIVSPRAGTHPDDDFWVKAADFTHDTQETMRRHRR